LAACIKCKSEIPDDSVFCLYCGKKQVKQSRSKTKRPNGSGSVYREGKTWTAEITRGYTLTEVNGKLKKKRLKYKKRGFATKALAMEFCAKPEKKKTAPTLEEIWAAWSTSDMTKLSQSKQTAFSIAHAKLLKTDVMFIPIDELRVENLQKAMDSVANTYYTARDIKTLFSHLYRRAQYNQDVSDNLALVLTLPELVENEPVPFTEVEQQKLWKSYAEGDLDAGWPLVMIYTGMMPGELRACRKDMIIWERGEIVGAGKKTKKRKETPIVFPDLLEPVLRALCESTKGTKLWSLNEDKFYQTYYAALERAGCRRLTPYSCRHTTATALARENLPPAVIQKVMRHAKYQSTQRYIHPDTNDMRAAINAIAPEKIAE